MQLKLRKCQLCNVMTAIAQNSEKSGFDSYKVKIDPSNPQKVHQKHIWGDSTLNEDSKEPSHATKTEKVPTLQCHHC